jgi:predicted nuclease with TOPRIM domain
MEKRIQIVIIGLVAILVVSLGINLAGYLSKQQLSKQGAALKQENESLAKKLDGLQADNRRLQEKINAVAAELQKAGKDKEEAQGKYTLVVKERDELAEKLRAKAAVEQERDKLKAEGQGLKQKLDAAEKQAAALKAVSASQEDLSTLKNENQLLKEQIKGLSGRKIELEKRLAQLQAGGTQPDAAAAPVSAVGQDSVELAPIVVRPSGESVAKQKAPPSSGKIIAVNRENNFVVIDVGENDGIKIGDAFQVLRHGNPIALVEVIQVRSTISACDIKNEASPVTIGDTIQ